MDARSGIFALLAFSALLGIEATAHADTKVVAKQSKRKGATFGLRLLSGPALHGPQGYTPLTRFSYTAGSAIHRQFVLGVDLGATAWWDQKKGSFHGDTFGQFFVTRGLFVRASAGVASHTFVASDRKAALGGSLGTGWEFPMGKHGFVALGGDYDVRVRSDRFAVRTFLFGFSIGGYNRIK